MPIIRWTSSTILDPCDNNNFSTFGQILDYKVNITAAPACSGAPNAGLTVSTETAVCPSNSFTLIYLVTAFLVTFASMAIFIKRNILA